uniref:CSON006926 protein n=1 Tax=Culicoides sonorensis TaxID=179676 RepID=A0A336MXF3_CULSO
MDLILENVTKKHASQNTIFHCLYDYFHLNMKQKDLAHIYNKDRKTIHRWITKYKKGEGVARKEREKVYLKFDEKKRNWIVKLYEKKPILTLNETQKIFYNRFHQSISASSVLTILKEAGLTWKRLERRAVQISLSDIVRFTLEINNIQWFMQSLVFADEISFDNRGMFRKNGYGLKGQKLIFRGEFTRKARVSALCFIGGDGLLNCYTTEGTFNRAKFVHFVKRFVLDDDSRVRTYPGRYSVLILDGAKIHLDQNFVSYFRSLGLVILFLPSYSPFYMPIEVVFALMKRELRKIYVENSKTPLEYFIGQVCNTFKKRDLRPIFQKCGYVQNGLFDPAVALGRYFHEMDFKESIQTDFQPENANYYHTLNNKT